MTFIQEFIAAVADYAWRRQITQIEIAHRTGIPQASLSAWFKGRRNFGCDKLNALAKFADVSVCPPAPLPGGSAPKHPRGSWNAPVAHGRKAAKP